MLHLKRPALVPIIDSIGERPYEQQAKDVAAEFGESAPLYWVAMWRDARSNSDEIASLADALRQDGGQAAHIGALAPLRLHDILVWTHFHAASGGTLSA
jgi:hypothetical protein